MPSDYEPRAYWHALHARQDLSSVGQSGLPARMNTWIYRSIERNLRRFVRQHDLGQGAGRRMLEVGVGTGYWVPFWRDLGWQVDGCDLVPTAVDQVSRAHPDGRFWAADVSGPAGVLVPSGGAAQEGYDLVTATSVLLHVTRPRKFRRALDNLAAAVAPGGHLLLVEPALLTTRRQPPFEPHRASRMRVLRSYARPLRESGLELVATGAATVLAANPLEARSPRRLAGYHWWWRQVRRTYAHPWLARLLGPAMYAADALLLRTGEAPTSKVLLFRRPAERLSD